MNIGFLMSDYNPGLIEFAGKAGFDCLEIFAFPGGHIDLNKTSQDDYKKINDTLKQNNVFMSTFACSVNHLDGNVSRRKENNDYFRKAIETCKYFNVDTLCTNAWGNLDLSPSDNVAVYKEVFSEYAKIAESNGIRIAIENCPHSDGYPILVKNIAHSPEMWEILFNEVSSLSIGLEFDPSHLFWQQINIEKAIHGFGDRIYAFHAKDTETVQDKMDQCGIYGKMLNKKSSWDYGVWRYRIPGWGDINWKTVFRSLVDVGYKGPVCIEHEDPVFENERFEEGLKLGLKFLRQFEL
jgi:sugar phosphate isomerase/epimerase